MKGNQSAISVREIAGRGVFRPLHTSPTLRNPPIQITLLSISENVYYLSRLLRPCSFYISYHASSAASYAFTNRCVLLLPLLYTDIFIIHLKMCSLRQFHKNNGFDQLFFKSNKYSWDRYILFEAWSGVNWADLMAAQGAFGTDFYDSSTRTIVGTMLWTEYRPVIGSNPSLTLNNNSNNNTGQY